MIFVYFFKKKHLITCVYSRNSLILQSFLNATMNYLSFREKLLPLGCFSIQQIALFFPNYDVNNITRWAKEGYLTKLRRGWYAFTEALQERDMALLIANQLVNPSYISLHYALAYYGMIPESVVQLTNVTTQRTAQYETSIACYSYQTIASHLYFGYQSVPMKTNILAQRSYLIATPEKALLDLLYLHPEYQSDADFLQLRLDEDFMQEELHLSRLHDYLQRWHSPKMTQRVKLLLKIYSL